MTCNAPGRPRRELALQRDELPPLPRQVVVSQHDPPAESLRHARHGTRRREVQRQRADVLDDEEIRVVDGVTQGREVDRAGVVDREPGDDGVVRTRPRPRTRRRRGAPRIRVHRVPMPTCALRRTPRRSRRAGTRRPQPAEPSVEDTGGFPNPNDCRRCRPPRLVDDLRSEPQQRRRGRRMTHIRPKLAWRVGPVVVCALLVIFGASLGAYTIAALCALFAIYAWTTTLEVAPDAIEKRPWGRRPRARRAPGCRARVHLTCRPSRAARSRSARWVRASRSSSGSGTTAASPRSSATSSRRPRTSATTTRARASCATPARQ